MECLVFTYDEGLAVLDTLAHAHEYLASQYSDEMKPAEARAHFDARALLIRRRFALLDEMELEYCYGAEAS